MRHHKWTRILGAVLTAAMLGTCLPEAGFAAQPQSGDQDQAPPSFAPDQLDGLVARVALYPDSLLSQVLSAATYPGRWMRRSVASSQRVSP